jgi:Ca2+-binding RTX toxin-like protein
MTTYKFNKTRDTTWEITTSGDTWILGEKGRIVGDGINGVYAADTITAATLRVNGRIDVGGNISLAGVRIDSASATIIVGDPGHIQGYGPAIYYNNSAGTISIDNSGSLAGIKGIAARAAQAGIEIDNAGTILGDLAGISAQGAGAEITNSGVIKGQVGISHASGQNDADPLLAESATHITNSGKITGVDESILAGNVAVNLRNKGTLNGNVSLGDGQDIVNNRGTINGDVWLGSNDDLFDGRGGRLNGILYGGDGNDVVTLASPATLYVERAGEGVDTVRINATYRLGANIEELQLLGKASYTGIGNSLNNKITGNKGDNVLYGLDGNDVLSGGDGRDRIDGGDGGDVLYGGWGRDTMTGGAGADYFGFYPECGRDTIIDFEIGIDKIDLENIDGIDNFADLDGKIVQSEANPADTIIRLGDTDMLILRDTVAASLADNDFYII